LWAIASRDASKIKTERVINATMQRGFDRKLNVKRMTVTLRLKHSKN